ncbi:MAG: rod shape-determining protein RodA [Bdellovibrionales bacterium]|nr:rod shape-determining protein RodA [Bdellovibrionales bacterium]
MLQSNLHVEGRTFFNRFDYHFAIVILSLNLIGLINLYSATHGVSITSTTKLFNQQILWLSVGWGLYFVVTLMDYNFFRRITYILYGINVFAMASVMVIGKSFYGAQRWLDLGFFRYQPSETMKLVLVLTLSHIIADKHRPEGLGLRDLFLPAVITGIPFVLTVKQPDLGTALLLIAISFSILFFAKIKKYLLILGLSVVVIAAPLVWSFGMKTYQKNRVLTFLDPGKDPRGTGYNSIQSKIAVGSGEFLGKGFRKGTQSQLEFLPERHTDFIYSVLSEEFGFLGSVSTFGLFIILYLMGIRASIHSKDKFGAFVSVGVLAYLFWHVFVNIGMVIGILPIVGVPLPLLSYGGSSLLSTMFGLGLISSISYRRYLF